MKWNHSKNNIITDEPILLPGTLVFLDLAKHSLILGESPYSGIYFGKLTKTGDFDKSPVAMIVALDCLENHYKVLVAEKLYWISTEAVSPASSGRRTTSSNAHSTARA